MAHFTEEAIKNTFQQLLEEKPLSKITVREIVETCGINRNTFYYHYADIPALIEEITLENAERAIARYPEVDSIEECLKAVISFAGEHKKAVLHIFNSANREAFEHNLWKVCEYVVRTYCSPIFQNKKISEADEEVIRDYYESLCFGVIINWIHHGMPDKIDKKVERLCAIKKGSMEEMLDRCEKK